MGTEHMLCLFVYSEILSSITHLEVCDLLDAVEVVGDRVLCTISHKWNEVKSNLK